MILTNLLFLFWMIGNIKITLHTHTYIYIHVRSNRWDIQEFHSIYETIRGPEHGMCRCGNFMEISAMNQLGELYGLQQT